MTRRGRATLALGVVVYLAAWLFGSRALYPAAVGLVLAVALALAWVRLSARAPHVHRHGAARDVVEGDDVRIDLVVEATGAVAPPTLVAHERPGRLGERRVELQQVGRTRFAGGYELRAVPRGRYAFETVRLTVEDPFGLAHAALEQGEPQALVVYPRLVTLARLFSEGGAHAQDGRRLLLRRPTGFELHSVREYVEGESLRKVHWPTTARRGQLMVKELEDAPRDEVVVVLDCDARAGTDDAFDVAVRAAGSVLQSHVRRGRRCALVLNSAARMTQPVTSDGDWRRALELLAAAERDTHTPVFAVLQADGGAAARALELVVVTSNVDAPLADRLVQRALSRRGASVVYVDAAGAPAPQLLRLQAVGIPVAVVRPGDDLAAALAPEARVA
ncbi:MAG TPA: DUF58 domain-containing protein [Gaiellaceae bacterium]|nr:DUF58 domain-containing protein [Gaiellaceae bacterium]